MLCDVGTYRRLTGDMASDDVDVTDALADAQSDVQTYLARPGKLIEQGTVTETLKVYRGTVFPSVLPIASVSDPPGLVVDRGMVKGVGGIISSGGGFITGYGPDDNLYPLELTLIYVGGWTPVGSGGLYEAPHKVIAGIARLAGLGLATPAQIPVGARSVQAGDVRVDYSDPQTPDAARLTILDTLRRFRYRALYP